MIKATGYQGNLTSKALVIANGQQSSGAGDLTGFTLCGFFTPAALTGTTLTFEVSTAVDGTFVPLKSTTSGTALSYTVAASGYYAVDPKDFYGVQFLKVKSGSAEGAARTVTLSLKGF
jgi:hypothetical protein